MPSYIKRSIQLFILVTLIKSSHMELIKEANHSLWLASFIVIQYNVRYIGFTTLIIQHNAFYIEFNLTFYPIKYK